jgi:aspartate aminotransferase-like enzyme
MRLRPREDQRMPMKHRLLTPGPTPVPEETLLELARPMVYHRTPQARDVIAEVVRGLQQVFCTRHPVMPLTCSGTGALEAALVNCVPPGGKAICLSAGKFGERWRSIAQAMGIEVVSVTAPYGQVVQPEQLARALGDHPDAVAVCSTLSETSTGAAHDIAAFGKLVAGAPAVLLVDAISGLVALECRCDDWQVDICVTGSQKALMLPPGLAFLSLSDKATKLIERNPNPRAFYFDLKKAREKILQSETPYTPAHTLLKALRVSLKRILDEGIENVWTRQARYAAAARAGVQALGLEIFPVRPSNALTVPKSPPGIDSSDLLALLEKKHGLKLANGQDSLKGKIFRLGHLGYIDQFDILAGIAGLELALTELGHRVELGSGLTAAQRVFAEF